MLNDIFINNRDLRFFKFVKVLNMETIVSTLKKLEASPSAAALAYVSQQYGAKHYLYTLENISMTQ